MNLMNHKETKMKQKIERISSSTVVEPIYLLYDERMLEHRPIDWIEPIQYPTCYDDIMLVDDDDYPVENPERIKVIFDRLRQLNYRYQIDVTGRYYIDESIGYKPSLYKHLTCRYAKKDDILLVHSEEQYERLNQLQFLSNDELRAMSYETRNDMYYCQKSFDAARLAAGGLLNCIDAILCGDVGDGGVDTSLSRNKHENTITNSGSNKQSTAPVSTNTTNKAIALVRPPGHHACQSKEMGFCFIDSVVVAAKYALKTYQQSVKRIVILDWDIHDGNATSDETLDNDNILRIDIHRYNQKEPFYPFTGSPYDIGNTNNAKGLNCNIGWTNGNMGNVEYAAAFYELVLLLIVNYHPDLLIISCGLDAAKGDLLGDCCLTPDFFHAMTRSTIEAVGPNTPILCALEGGYTINVIPDCMEAVTLGFLNIPYSYHSNNTITKNSSRMIQSSFGCNMYNDSTYSNDSEQKINIGAAEPLLGDNDDLVDQNIRNTNNALLLERSRQVLRYYYTRVDISCSNNTNNDIFLASNNVVTKSAIRDINKSIRIFRGLERWKHIPFKLINNTQQQQQSQSQSPSPSSSPISKVKRACTTNNNSNVIYSPRSITTDDLLLQVPDIASGDYIPPYNKKRRAIILCNNNNNDHYKTHNDNNAASNNNTDDAWHDIISPSPLFRPRIYLWYGTEQHHRHNHYNHHHHHHKKTRTTYKQKEQLPYS